MWGQVRNFAIRTDRIELRLPRRSDFVSWARQRRASAEFHRPWVPTSFAGVLSRAEFGKWVRLSHRSFKLGTEVNLLVVRRSDQALLGCLACKNIRRGTMQSGILSYWIGKEFARSGYMSEAVAAFVGHAFSEMELGRLEAACLPENAASRGLLVKTGFREEGRAAAYLQIAGVWRDHILYSRVRADRQACAQQMETVLSRRSTTPGSSGESRGADGGELDDALPASAPATELLTGRGNGDGR